MDKNEMIEMKPGMIVYTSNTGHTERYAKMLGDMTGLPVCELCEAERRLTHHERVIYMGWLFASSVKGYAKANKLFDIKAVVGVGLCPTGALLDEVREAIKLPNSTPLFTVQGGMDYEKLRGINKFMIDMLKRSLAKKRDRSKQEEATLELLSSNADLVSPDNLESVVKWIESEE